MMCLPASIGTVAPAGASVPATSPVWDAASVSAPLTLSVGDTTVNLPVNNTGVAKTVRSSKPITAGKWYWEVAVKDCIPGAGTSTGCGLADSSFAFATSNLGANSTATAGGLWLSGRLYFAGAFTQLAITFAPGDVMMFAFDKDTGSLWVGKNGVWVGDPAAGTGASKTGLNTTLTYYPAASPWSSDATHPVVLQIRGDTNAVYPAPSGFTPYNK